MHKDCFLHAHWVRIASTFAFIKWSLTQYYCTVAPNSSVPHRVYITIVYRWFATQLDYFESWNKFRPVHCVSVNNRRISSNINTCCLRNWIWNSVKASDDNQRGTEVLDDAIFVHFVIPLFTDYTSYLCLWLFMAILLLNFLLSMYSWSQECRHTRIFMRFYFRSRDIFYF